MSSRHGVRPLRLMVVAAVIALLSTLFAATAAHAGTGSIAGKVTKAGGTAVGNTLVDLYSIDEDGFWFERSVKTRSDGTYTFGSLDRGQYTVGFGYESATYAAEFWNNQTLIQNAAAISVGSTRVSSINARLAVGGKVTGTVRVESSGQPVMDAEVAAYRYDDGEWTFGKSVFTASNGSFNLGGLSDGQWTLEFNPPWVEPGQEGNADLALEYWEDSRTFDANETFLVKPGMTVGGKNADLAQGGQISGRVTGPNGEPVVDALVFGYPSNNEYEVGTVAFTDENGDYFMTGMSEGEHRLEFIDSLEFDNPFGDEGYASEWWNNQASIQGADPITVTAGDTTTGKDAQLARSSEPLVNVTPPTVSGEPRVGEVQTADPGTWTPNMHESDFTYQWLLDGAEIPGATERTYTPYGGLVNRQIYVEVTATRGDGQSVTLASKPTALLAEGVFSNITKPYLTGDLRVGSVVSLHAGEWSSVPEREYHVLFADGRWVADGNAGMQHRLTPDLLGKKLSVRSVVGSAGFDSMDATSDETAPVSEGIFAPPSEVEIQGVPIVGVPVETKLLNPSDVATNAYQWLADGETIAGADQATFTPTSAEVGKALSVRLTTSSPGWKTAEKVGNTSAPVVEAGTLHVTPGTPTISGDARVGQTLSGSPGSWAPAGATLTYAWLADGEPIPDATETSFTLTSAQDAKKISFKVTGARPGYTSASAVSAETASVRTSTPFGAPHDLESPSSTATSIDLTWTDVDNAAGYRIYYGIGSGTRTKVEVGDVTSKTLKGLKPNTAYTIDIAALRSNGTRSSYSPRITARTALLTAPIDLKVTRESPTSVTLAWTKVPGISKYRISHRIGTDTRTTLDVGDVSTKTITGLKPGTTYSIAIASLLSDGTRSSYSPPIDAPTALFLPPTNLASPGATSSTIDLTWTKAPAATRYRISYGIGDGARTGFTIADASSRTLTGLMPGTTYNVMIAGIMSDGTRSPYSPPLDVTTD